MHPHSKGLNGLCLRCSDPWPCLAAMLAPDDQIVRYGTRGIDTGRAGADTTIRVHDEEMPRHRIASWLVRCTCGQTMPVDNWEAHVAREAKEVGRWIADRALRKMGEAISGD